VLSEHGIYLRERYLSYDASTFTRPVRATMLRFFKHLSWVGYQVAAAVAPVCDYNCQWLEANGCDPEQIRRIYNGVDVADIGGNGAEPEAPTLVWMGRIDPLKDVETLLKTFAGCIERCLKPAENLRSDDEGESELPEALPRPRELSRIG